MIPKPTDPKKTWFCGCQKHCKGGKYVQKRTYDRHAAIREVEEQVDHAEHIRRFGAAQPIPDFTRRRRRKQKNTASTSVHFLSQPEQAGPSSASQQNCPTHENNFSDHEMDVDTLFGQEPDFDALQASVDGLGRDSLSIDTAQLRGIWGQNGGEDEEMEHPELSDEIDDIPDSENSIPDIDDDTLPDAHIPVLQLAQKLIENIKTAKLEDDITDEDILHSIRNPESEMPELDRLTMLALKIFNGLIQGTQQMYNDVRDALLWFDPSLSLDSYYVMQKKIAKITGVYQVTTDMCPNSCVAYTGPFATFTECPKCEMPRYHLPQTGTRRKNRKRTPKQQFYTFPLGPQLQALWRSPQGAHELRYRNRKTEEILNQLKQTKGKIPIYEDVFHGTEYLNAIRSGQIQDDDTLVTISIDGAQLYQDKASDCWFGIWIILDLSPGIRYKKKYIMPALIVPGPNPPDITESFLLPAFRHCSALQQEGLRAWDGQKLEYITSRPFFSFGTADTVGIVVLNGFVGHNGGHGCRLHCGFHGRHKPNQGTYYAAALRPNGYTVKSCMHPDFDIEKIGSPNIDVYKRSLRLLMLSPNESQYKKRRLLTGIVKPSICLGFQDECMLSVPSCFPLDLMHLISLNIPQHLVQVWRNSGEIKIEYTVKPDFIIFDDDSAWQRHGALVALATPYLPTAFERPPRNPAEKINSGYKAMEFLLYLWGLGPAVFRPFMPHGVWTHYCKLVRGIRILQQRRITWEQLQDANNLLMEWEKEFELKYYNRQVDRLHLMRPCLHSILHAPRETRRCGPLNLLAQWALENTIGNLGREVHQLSNPFSNLAERALLRCRINALKVLVPELEHKCSNLPKGSSDLGNGYALLPACDTHLWHLPEAQAAALTQYLTESRNPVTRIRAVHRWARLRLPNGQDVRSRWNEEGSRRNTRVTRNVKVSFDETTHFAEVHYYFQPADVCGKTGALAMVSMYSVADPILLSDSHDTLSVCQHGNEHGLQVIDVKKILSLIAMVPFPLTPGEEADPVIKAKYADSFYMVEKPFLDFIGGEGAGGARPEGVDMSAEDPVEAQELESSDAEDEEY